MPCFLNTNAAPDTNVDFLDPMGQTVSLIGSWNTEQDSKGLEFLVSKTKGDAVVVVFTGTAIFVSGRINSEAGMKALFGIDVDGEENGGTFCTTATQPRSSILLYGESALPQGRHTLFITNQDSLLSLSGFQVGGVSTTPSSRTSTASPTPTTSFSGTTLPSHASSLTNVTPLPTRTTTSAGEGSPSQDGSGFGMTTIASTVSGPPSSIYTTVSILDGTTTTVVIASTVGTSQRPSSHGPSPSAISGAVVGGIVFLSLFLLGIALWWRRARHGNPLSFLKGAKNSDPGPEMATRLTPSTAPSICRPESLAIPSVLEITSGGAPEHFHLDTDPGEAQGSPPSSLPPSFHSHPDASPGLDGNLPRSDAVDVAVSNRPAIATINPNSKMDAMPGEFPATGSTPPFRPDETTGPNPATSPGGERNGWRVHTRTQMVVEEDGGVRLAGGPLRGAGEEDDLIRWEVLPPPYPYHIQ